MGMTIEEQIMKLQTYKMFEDEDTVYVERDDILELLKQQPCEDVISRQAVLDNAYAYGNGLEPEGYCVNVEDIQALPSVTPKVDWIPVSERLPEIHQDVLLSLRSLDIEVGFRAVTERYFCCHSADGAHYIEPQNVLAWQPLPEPYKAESEE